MDITDEIDPRLSIQQPCGHASLLFTWDDRSQALALREGQTVVVGRTEPSQLVIESRSLSRIHAQLSLHDGHIVLEDLDSTNGCSLNGAPLRSATMGQDDVALLGTVEMRVCGVPYMPRCSGVLSHARFMNALSEEIMRARLFGRHVSVVAFTEGALPGAFDAAAHALKPIDRLCSFAPAVGLVLLPEQDSHDASGWLEAVRWPRRSELRIGIASYPQLACKADELVSRALDGCHLANTGETRAVAPLEDHTVPGPVLISSCMLRLYDLVTRAARTTLPVLVQGETGSGKELVARSLHDRSSRAKAPFKALNCATIPANLLESVLFGHERGAFTGADRQSKGVFEQAQGGTVFLDEIGELSAQAQGALLRVLDQRQLVRVGGTREIAVDARVVAATHRDLAAMVAAGTFREDLMFRLDALTLTVPPLRERRDEIPALASLFLGRAKSQWGASAERLSDDALEALTTYPWPGNVRQLKNVIERAMVVCPGEVIEPEHLPGQVWTHSGQTWPADGSNGAAKPECSRSLFDKVREFELALLREALNKAQWNQSQAARILGIPRRTLANKVHAYGLL